MSDVGGMQLFQVCVSVWRSPDQLRSSNLGKPCRNQPYAPTFLSVSLALYTDLHPQFPTLTLLGHEGPPSLEHRREGLGDRPFPRVRKLSECGPRFALARRRKLHRAVTDAGAGWVSPAYCLDSRFACSRGLHIDSESCIRTWTFNDLGRCRCLGRRMYSVSG